MQHLDYAARFLKLEEQPILLAVYYVAPLLLKIRRFVMRALRAVPRAHLLVVQRVISSLDLHGSFHFLPIRLIGTLEPASIQNACLLQWS